ncbi:hypothetical protein BDV06DRAFT_61088 [Aspergillus oleicola]
MSYGVERVMTILWAYFPYACWNSKACLGLIGIASLYRSPNDRGFSVLLLVLGGQLQYDGIQLCALPPVKHQGCTTTHCDWPAPRADIITMDRRYFLASQLCGNRCFRPHASECTQFMPVPCECPPRTSNPPMDALYLHLPANLMFAPAKRREIGPRVGRLPVLAAEGLSKCTECMGHQPIAAKQHDERHSNRSWSPESRARSQYKPAGSVS